ncbi:MAG: hypothetical protein AABP62_23960 [Planctomycetota bacterium]
MSSHLGLSGMGHHLSQVEGLIDDVVMNDVGRAEIEAKELEREEHPVAQNLILEKDVSFGDVPVVMAGGRHEHQAALSQHIGKNEQNGQVTCPRPAPGWQETEGIRLVCPALMDPNVSQKCHGDHVEQRVGRHRQQCQPHRLEFGNFAFDPTEQ